jgi:hypothetical protein
MTKHRSDVRVIGDDGRIEVSRRGARFLRGDDPAQAETFPGLRAAVTAHPDLLASCELEGITGDELAALVTAWELHEVPWLEAGDDSYTWDDGILCPTDYDVGRDCDIVASRTFGRYGGDFGPCSTTDHVQINRSAASGSPGGSSGARRRSGGSPTLGRARGVRRPRAGLRPRRAG